MEEESSTPNAKRQRIQEPQKTQQTAQALSLPARLGDITFQQRNSYTCYFLSSLDSLLHHPQGREILGRIRIQKAPNGYSVKFPAQPNAIHVTQADLNRPETVTASHKLVPILEQAYLKIPGVRQGEHDNAQAAMARIFGAPSQASLTDLTDLSTSIARAKNGTTAQRAATAQIWTAAKVHEVNVGSGTQRVPEQHYHSVRVNGSQPGHQVTFANPFNTRQPQRCSLEELSRGFHLERVDIPLGVY